jgi:hypothetical protein
MPICNRLCTLDRLIGHTDESRSRQGGIEARMVLPEMSDSNDTGTDRLHRIPITPA